MRVLHVVTRLDLGGAEKALLKYLRMWPESETDHVVIDVKGGGELGDEFRAQGFAVHDLHLTFSGLGIIRSIYNMISLTKVLQPDLVLGWMYQGNLVASAMGLMARVPVVWNVRHAIDDLAGEGLGRRWVIAISSAFSTTVAKVIYNSTKSRVSHERLGLDRSRGEVIPNGFDLDFFRPDREKRSLVRRELNIRDDAFVVGTVARNHPDKGYDILLQALVPLLVADQTLKMVCVGEGVTSTRWPFSDDIGVGTLPNLILTGPRSDVAAILNACDLYVSPSRTESFPNVIGEAMATALPIVATDVGDCGLLVNGAGEIVCSSDPEKLRRAVVAHRELSFLERRELGCRAREKIANLYELNSIVERLANVCEALVLKPSSIRSSGSGRCTQNRDV